MAKNEIALSLDGALELRDALSKHKRALWRALDKAKNEYVARELRERISNADILLESVDQILLNMGWK